MAALTKPTDEKDDYNYTTSSTSVDGLDDEKAETLAPEVGELSPLEAVTGGLGRHLGVWSTTCLM